MAVNCVSTIDDRVRIQNVIVSVYDKEGLDALVEGLLKANPECMFYATGGSFAGLASILKGRAKTNLTALSEFTGQPEMQGGLVKTLDFKIYLGLLSETYNPDHQTDLAARTGGVVFDMVVSNLYPFERVVSQTGVSLEAARANIDIGGPCLVRAAAKNFHRVAAVTDKADYARLVEIVNNSHGTVDVETRFTLARKAFLMIARYDAVISDFLMNVGSERMKRCYTFPKKGA